MMRRLRPLLLLLPLLAGCEDRIDPDEPVTVSVIGAAPQLVDPSQKRTDAASELLLASVAQGLVRFDGGGQIEAGLAIRWDVSDDGLYYTFRLAEGFGIDAEDVARRHRAAIGPTSRNPLKGELGAIAEIVAVTPEILEIRLSAPRPALLQLLAQPALALIGSDGGSGPLAIDRRESGALILTPRLADDADPPGEDARAPREIVLRGERAALAVARCAQGRAGLVTGGTLTDLPVARAANPAPRALRIDPAIGLMGFAIVDAPEVLQPPENRAAIAMAIDRQRIATAFGLPDWRVETGLVPAGAAEIGAPAQPGWTPLTLVDRATLAQRTIAAWRLRTGAPAPALRVAMPGGAGARLLFALVRQDWARIGVEAVAVAPTAEADLRFLDEVAPSDSASWWLQRYRCGVAPVCSAQADLALDAAGAAVLPAERARWLADADARLLAITPLIPIARPLRWSLVAPGLDGWRENGRAAHPLDQLRGDAANR